MAILKRKDLWSIFLAFLGFLYLLNLGLGVVEVLPDATPFIGNLDEFSASWLIIRLFN